VDALRLIKIMQEFSRVSVLRISIGTGANTSGGGVHLYKLSF